jgi:hypothetical protein
MDLDSNPDPATARRQALIYASMFTSALFEEVANADTISLFATVAGLGEQYQDFIREYPVNIMMSKFDVFAGAITTIYSDVNDNNFRPYMTDSETPNILSPFHLVSQALCHEHVSSLKTDLTLSPG